MTAKLFPDLKEARRFLDLFGEGLLHRFQVFSDEVGVEARAKHSEAIPPWHAEGDLDELAPRLMFANNNKQGVFFVVNETSGGRLAKDVTNVRAIFLDLDGSPLEPVLATGVEPHAVVCSSPGKYQVYWLVKHCPLDRFSSIQAALAEKFSGDFSVGDLSRVMRVPGFWHQKKAPSQVKLQSIEYFMPYSLDPLVDALGIADLEKDAVLKQALPPLSELYQQKIQEGDRHNKLMRYASKFAYDGKTQDEVYGMIQGINHVCCVKPKPEKEIRAIVESAVQYAGIGEGFQYVDDEERDHHTDLALPEAFVVGAPGLVGKIADWIDSTTTRSQPHFAIAASLAFVGVLKAHRVQSPRRSRTNHMTLALGKPSSGKSEAGDRLDDLIRCTGLDKMVMGVPSSDSAIRVALGNRGGRAFLYWDEMGLALERMLSKNSQAYHAAIKDLLVELWTKPHSILRKKEFATSESQKGHVDIHQPCFGLYGTAQPDVFYNSLSGAHAADGFFPRLLVFETEDNYPPERKVIYAPPPDSLIHACQEIDAWPTSSAKGNVADTIIDPRVVSISPSAQKLFDAAKKDVEKKLTKNSDSLSGGIWGRALSHMEKIALTVEDGPVITRESAEWSIDLVTRLSASMASAFKLRVSDSAIERTKKKVLQEIVQAKGKGLSTNTLTRKTQFLRDKRERDAVLSELENSGQVVIITETIGGRAVKKWFTPQFAPGNLSENPVKESSN